MRLVTRARLEASLSDLVTQVADPRAGILGPASAAWRLGGDLAIFLGGGRAALLQLAHPKVALAIDHHSRTRSDIGGRFQRTFAHVFAMMFGELADAVRAARRVHAIHERVHGTFVTAVGPFPAGTPYHANDEDALRWVHATLVDTTLAVRARLDPALPTALLDQYVVDLNRFAALFGIASECLPASHAEHVAYMQRMLASGELVVTPAAREMGHFLFGRTGSAQPLMGRLAEATSAELLPPEIARAFGLRHSPRLVAGSIATARALHRRLPPWTLRLPAHAVAQARLRGRPPSPLAAWTERQLFGLAKRVAG